MFFYLSIAALIVASSYAQHQECPRRNGYFKYDSSCDTYVECRDHKSHRMMCPDGLNYNPNIEWPEYPCSFPEDMPCDAGRYQQPKPSGECPQQYGFYPHPSATDVNCAPYKMCVAGVAFDMKCAAGLAFNPDIGRCDWADRVPSCNAERYLGFKCPEIPIDADGDPIDIVLNYSYPSPNCTSFFSCDKGRARFLSCDLGLAFDESIGRCRDADLVQCNY
ncbi:protein obstructor-E [Manduca sexta]|uniref:protein obstructor-E n=1 Tax=Manduca sexta TaxID=7130 RepID=UPI001182B7BE|nr:protein obstructor-E [Manduca sexta]